MKTKFYLLLFFCLGSAGHRMQAQGYVAGVQTLTFTDASRGNRSIPVELHYPATVAGSGAAIAADSFPFAVFGHGFVMTAACYYPFSDSLAAAGYIVAFPTTESGLSPSHADFAQDLIFVYHQLIEKNSDSLCFLYRHVRASGAIGGHSMGGGCTVLSAQYANPAQCYFTFAEATTNPSSIAAAPKMTKPYLSLAGSYDCIAPYSSNQLPTYDSSASPCKFLIEVKGASHCQWGLSNTACNFGETASGCANPPMGRAVQIQTGLAYLKPFLDYYLKGENAAFATFDSLYLVDTAATKLNNCMASPMGLKTGPDLGFRIYPNPVADRLLIEFGEQIAAVSVCDMEGRLLIAEKAESDHLAMETSSLPPGIYVAWICGIDGQKQLFRFAKE